MGRTAARGGAGVARRSGAPGRAALRSGAAGADRAAVGAGAGRDQPVLGSWAAVAGDGDLRAVDGAQAPVRVGVRDVDARGIGLDPSAALLPAGTDRAGARRVDRAQVDAPAGARGGAPALARVDWEGPAREALSSAGGADRLDRGRGRHSLSDRLGAGGRRGQGAGPGGAQAGGEDRRQAHRGQGSLARGRATAARDHAHDAPPLRAGQGRGAQAHRADRRAARHIGQGGAAARRRGQAPGPGARRPGQAQGRASARGARRPLREGHRADPTSGSRARRSPTGSSRCGIPTPGRSARASSHSPTSLAMSISCARSPPTPSRARAGSSSRPQARSATRARTRCCRPPQPSWRTSTSSCAR